jgi:hypothetical protein
VLSRAVASLANVLLYKLLSCTLQHHTQHAAEKRCTERSTSCSTTVARSHYHLLMRKYTHICVLLLLYLLLLQVVQYERHAPRGARKQREKAAVGAAWRCCNADHLTSYKPLHKAFVARPLLLSSNGKDR